MPTTSRPTGTAAACGSTNPPWEISDLTVEKLVDEPPAELVVLGDHSNKAWVQASRQMGCAERIVPKKGTSFFTQL